MNLTHLLIRFIKEQGIYEDFIKEMKYQTILYDGVIDNLHITNNCNVKFLLNRGVIGEVISIILNHAYDEKIDMYNKWAVYVEKHKFEIKPSNQYFNIATPFIKEFLIENNALREVTKVLNVRKLIEGEIKNNDLDILLRRKQAKIPSFFQNVGTFCTWDLFQKYEPKHITWRELSTRMYNKISYNMNLHIIP